MGLEIDPKTGAPVSRIPDPVSAAPQSPSAFDSTDKPAPPTGASIPPVQTDEAHKGAVSDLVTNAAPLPNASLPAKPHSEVRPQPGVATVPNRETREKAVERQKSREELDRDAEKERKDKLKLNKETRMNARQDRIDRMEKSIVLSQGRLDLIQQVLKDSGTDSMGQAKGIRRIEELLNPPLSPLTKGELKELDELMEMFEDEDKEMTAEQSARFMELDTRMELNKLNSVKQ